VTAPMRVGLIVSRAGWSAQLRSYIHDHVSGLTVEAILDSEELRRPRNAHLDVLVLDDSTRILSGADIGGAVASGTVVFGLFNPRQPAGRDHLNRLGVSHTFSVDTDTAQLAAAIAAIGPATPPPNGQPRFEEPYPELALANGAAHRHGTLTVMSAATGGAGLTETVIGLANQWSGHRSVLVIEANPLAATMAARLRRPTGFGLGWALGLAAQNQPVFPGGLTPAVGPTGRGLGNFDVICQSSTPGGPSPASPTHLFALVDAALGRYDHVVVEIGPLVLESSPGLDRFAAGRNLLARADQVIVMAGADPEAVVQLGEWKAAARTLKVTAPCWAIFGRIPKGNYEASHLRASLEATTGSEAGHFAHIDFLPDDPHVARARWNGEVVTRGRWFTAVAQIAHQFAGPAAVTHTAASNGSLPALTLTTPVKARQNAWS
jgi:hypothetical protein